MRQSQETSNIEVALGQPPRIGFLDQIEGQKKTGSWGKGTSSVIRGGLSLRTVWEQEHVDRMKDSKRGMDHRGNTTVSWLGSFVSKTGV